MEVVELWDGTALIPRLDPMLTIDQVIVKKIGTLDRELKPELRFGLLLFAPDVSLENLMIFFSSGSRLKMDHCSTSLE